MANTTRHDNIDDVIISTTEKVFIIWATLVTEVINGTQDPVPFSSNYLEDTSEIENSNTSTGIELDLKTENLLNSSNIFKNNSESSSAILLGPIVWSGPKIGVFLAGLSVMSLTIFGNLLVVLSVVLDKKLQTPFNYYVVNLALTDLNVGCSGMTFYTIYNLYGYFPFDFNACCYWIWSDFTMTFESVVTLAAIGIDRLWSVTWTMHYRQHNSGRKSLWIIIGTWIYVNIIWQPAYIWDRVNNADGIGECGWTGTQNLHSIIYVGVLLYFIPLTVMVVSYARIFYVMRHRLNQIGHRSRQNSIAVVSSVMNKQAPSDNNADHQVIQVQPASRPVASAVYSSRPLNDLDTARIRRERRAFHTLGHIVIAFIICWIPWYFYFMINPFHPDLFPEWFYVFSYWMSYLNSAVNPIVYAIGNEDFRRSFKTIISFRYCQKNRKDNNSDP